MSKAKVQRKVKKGKPKTLVPIGESGTPTTEVFAIVNGQGYRVLEPEAGRLRRFALRKDVETLRGDKAKPKSAGGDGKAEVIGRIVEILATRDKAYVEGFAVSLKQMQDERDEQDENGHGVVVEVGHRVWAMKDSDCYEHGVVTSIADDGCFIRQDETGDVFAAEWASVVVHTQQAVAAEDIE